MPKQLDEIDWELAVALQDDARRTNAELGERVGLAPSSTHERVRRLEERGDIRGYHARLDPEAFGLGLTAFVFVEVDEIAAEPGVAEGLRSIPGVQAIYHVAGEDCFLVKMWASDAAALGRSLRRDFAAAGARSTRTTLVLETVMDRPGIPVDAASGRDG